jgi:hypothetical protein
VTDKRRAAGKMKGTMRVRRQRAGSFSGERMSESNTMSSAFLRQQTLTRLKGRKTGQGVSPSFGQNAPKDLDSRFDKSASNPIKVNELTATFAARQLDDPDAIKEESNAEIGDETINFMNTGSMPGERGLKSQASQLFHIGKAGPGRDSTEERDDHAL